MQRTSDDKANTFSRIRCKFCGSLNFKKAGKRHNKNHDDQMYRCKNKECGRKFSLSLKYLSPEERYLLLETYYNDVLALRSVPYNADITSLRKLGKIVARSTSGLSYLVRKEADRVKDGMEITLERRSKLGRYMGIDSTNLKIKRVQHYYWHAVDTENRQPIHYEITPGKDEDTIIRILAKIKYQLGYEPKVIIIDLDPALLSAVKRVFPGAIIQLCVFHRIQENNKGLPTEGWLAKKIKQERLKLWIEYKELCRRICYADDISSKEKLLALLKSREQDWMNDKRIKTVYLSFISNIQYYHTTEEIGDCSKTNNECEALIKLIKRVHNKMLGMKTVDSARTHVKGFWAVYMNRAVRSLERSDLNNNISQAESFLSADYTLPTKKRSRPLKRKRELDEIEPIQSLLVYC